MPAGKIAELHVQQLVELRPLQIGGDRSSYRTHQHRLQITRDAFDEEGEHNGNTNAPDGSLITINKYVIHHRPAEPGDHAGRGGHEQHAYDCRCEPHPILQPVIHDEAADQTGGFVEGNLPFLLLCHQVLPCSADHSRKAALLALAIWLIDVDQDPHVSE